MESKHDKPHIQEHYYETGSESGTESEGNEKLVDIYFKIIFETHH